MCVILNYAISPSIDQFYKFCNVSDIDLGGFPRSWASEAVSGTGEGGVM